MDDPARTFFALNELAVTRGANGRIIDFSLGISGAHIADMRGDGLVVATATGSTAYALSAGGPLVAPGFNGLVAVPLAPHTLHSRAIVTAANDVVEMDLSLNRDPREAALFADGELLSFDAPVKRVYVSRGAVPTTLLRYRHDGFYEKRAPAAEACFSGDDGLRPGRGALTAKGGRRYCLRNRPSGCRSRRDRARRTSFGLSRRSC